MTLFGLLFPILSGMEKGHEDATWKGIRMILGISVPLMIILATYPDFFLTLFDPNIASGAPTLIILSISIFFACYVNGINSMVFSKGMYRYVLGVGLSQSIIRIILYFLLVPTLGAFGAAISFSIGMLASFLVSLVIAHRVHFKLQWRPPILYVSVLGGLGAIFWFVNLPWWLGIPSILGLSVLTSGRTRIILYKDLKEIIPNMLSERLINRFYPRLYPILQILFPPES